MRPVLLGLAALLVVGASAVGAWWVRARWQADEKAPAPPPSAKGDVKRGALIYQANCRACHGPEGHGDGGVSIGTKPPRDFFVTPWRFGATEATVRRVIRDGIAGTTMPGINLPESDLDAVTAYVLSLAPPEAREIPRISEAVAQRLKRLGFTAVERPTFAPDLALHDLDDRSLALKQRRGKVVLLNFWGTTCTTCLKELPELEKLARELGDDLAVISVCFDETNPADVARLVKGRLHEMPVYVNPDGLARVRYDVQAMPSLYLLDAAGRLMGHATGGRAWPTDDMRELVRALKE